MGRRGEGADRPKQACAGTLSLAVGNPGNTVLACFLRTRVHRLGQLSDR